MPAARCLWCIDPPFEDVAVAKWSASNPDDRERLTIPLCRKHLVQTGVESIGAGAHYRFAHALVREAAYQGMLKRTRAMLHERFVGWADRVNEDRDRAVEFEEILGYHLEQAYRYRSDLGPRDQATVALGARASDKLASAGRRAR